MKKIYLFLLAMLGMAIGTQTFAQDEPDYGWDVDEAVITSVDQLYSPFNEPTEGALENLFDENTGNFWHSIWSANAAYEGKHYLQVEMPDWVTEDTELVMRFTRRAVDNDHTIVWSIRGTNEDVDWSAENETEELLLADTPFSSNTETLTTESFSTKGYRFIRIYSEQQAPSTRTYWHVSELNFYTIKKLTLEEYVDREKQKVLDEYSIYQGTFIPGTTAGYYGEAEVEEFEAALQAIYDLDEPGAELPSAEVLLQMVERVKAAYEAVVASQVSTSIEDGYYRILSGMWYTNTYEDEDGNTETVEHRKYMMGHRQNGKLWGIWASGNFGGTSAEARKLWKITAKDGYYDMVNMYNDARFLDVAKSTNVEMSTESENLVAIESAGVDWDEQVYVHIRIASQDAAADGLYLHQGNHGNGTGENGFLVGWYSSWDEASQQPQGSEWILEPVSDEEAEQIIQDYEPIKNKSNVVQNINTILADAKSQIKIAQDIQTIWDEEPLIHDVNQLSSPYTEPNEGALANLLDGKKDNFWHSIWSNGNAPTGLHYLQVELVDDDIATVAFQGYRRNADNDHVVKWSIFGTNEEDLENELGREGCDSLIAFETPFGAANEYIESPVFDTKGYKYLRLYADATNGTGGSSYANRGYWHMAELQLYRAQLYQSETCQYNVLGDIVKNLEAVVAEADDIDADEAEIEDLIAYYDKLKAAYEPFAEKFVDPAALREAVAAAQEKTASVVVGTNPGFWPDKNAADALDLTVKDATAYDASGAYTPGQSEAFIQLLEAQGNAVDAAVNTIQPGKWYRIRLGSVEEYEANGWSTTPGTGSNADDIFGKYATPAQKTVETRVNEEGKDYDFYDVEPIQKDDIVVGTKLFFENLDEIEDPDFALFRFIAVGDTAYALQNKATGLFVRANGTSGQQSLSIHPSLFNVEAMGYGPVLLAEQSLAGASQNYMHVQTDGNSSTPACAVVTWNATALGSNSTLYIETAEDVAADYAVTDFQMEIIDGAVNALCYPVAVKALTGQMYGVSATELTEEGVKVTLVKIAEASAGRPFIYISGNTDDYDSQSEADLLPFTHGMDIVAEPDNNSALKGSFDGETIGLGFVQITATGFAPTKTSSASVKANGAYIAAGEDIAKTATVEIVFSDGQDGIAALNKVAKNGAIYTIDGRYVGNGNLNTVSSLNRGIYILNGAKVIVK